MLGLLQRVSEASVTVGDECVGRIESGLVVLVGVQANDTEASAQRLAEKLLAYRVFTDDSRRMNLSVTDVGGGVLLVPQFTLAADTSSGLRPSLSTAAPPDAARILFDRLVSCARAAYNANGRVETGRFGAYMQVALTNDGPVTFMLSV